MVIEESIASVRCDEETKNHVVDDSFETLREERLRAWLGARKEGKKASHARLLHNFPPTRLQSCG
jgi:hypothetical protein